MARITECCVLEALAERHDPSDPQAHQKQQQQTKVEGRPFPELRSVYVCESQGEGNHHSVEDVLIAGILALEVHGSEPEQNLDDDHPDRRRECGLKDATGRTMDCRQGDSKQPCDPANNDGHPAPD